MDPLKPYYKTIEDTKAKGLFTPVRVLESPQGPWITIDGKKLLNFCSNNYLGLAQDKRLVNAVTKAVKKYGVGAGAVRPISGNLKLHMEAEAALAKFKGAEAAFLLPGGFIANIVDFICKKSVNCVSNYLRIYTNRRHNCSYLQCHILNAF